MSNLPPTDLVLPDPSYGDKKGPYAYSPLADVCGTRINPSAKKAYGKREILVNQWTDYFNCAHPDIEAWVGSIRGFDPASKVAQPPLKDWPLTSVMARVDVRSTGVAFPLPDMTYFVDYASFHSEYDFAPEPGGRADTIKENFFPEKSRLVLSFYNDRAQKLALWALRRFWDLPFLDQFDAVLMPDFYAYCNDPVPRYLIGERMMQIFAEEGSRAGRTVIPSIAWSTEESLRRQVELWTSQPNINTIRIDCLGSGVNKHLWAWRWIFALEKYFQGFDHIRWIITGMTAGWTIRELNRIFPKKNYSLVSPLSTYIAAQRRSMDRDWSAQEFRRRIAILEDFRSGKEIAEPEKRPEHWPTFEESSTIS